MRYIPELSLKQPLSDDSFFDAEISLDASLWTESGDSNDDYDLDLYRLKLRYATAQTETRIGLQQINFGPAHLLRSLRWFDRLDPADPLQLTDGIYGLLFKYYAMNNANFWLWGLVGNDDPKGLEALASVDDKPEFGGRLQYPVPRGELAATVHTRQVDGSRLRVSDFTENRFALDGHWDVEVGLWFESVFQQQDTDIFPYEWTKMTTLGLDYTFGVGNGLYALAEHMAVVSSDEPLDWDEDVQVSAVSLSYPIGLSDNLMAIGYYSWDQEESAQYLSWQRTYDNLIIHVGLFHYPDDAGGFARFDEETFFAGYGGQLLLIFNH